MKRRILLTFILVVPAVFVATFVGRAQSPTDFEELELAFKGAQIVDLRTSKVSSVVTLREVVKIPPPSEPVLVKVFRRESLPPVLQPAFSKPGVTGVTIAGRYVAILHTEFRKEYEDILRHELVHAYVTLTSPKPLPFWFQEAGAVLFSMGKGRKFYGQPSKTQTGVTVGKIVDLDPTYKQKLQSFNYLIEKAGKKRFYEWYRNCVLTGEVNASALLEKSKPTAPVRPPVEELPAWLWVVAATVVIVVAVVGFYAARREIWYE
ncbi:MAG: hypothetical protein N3B12_04190 [Armatimonadetes bacterium]|nr:hypothetical protein [Armatimonadota bacterium]